MKVSATLPVPNLSRADDQEIESLFRSFDGRWSAQTKALLAQHGVERLDLDDNWASVPPIWRCTPCGRYKTELARLSDSGVLICRLDRHHDHLRDYGKRVLRRDGNRPSEPEAFAASLTATGRPAAQYESCAARPVAHPTLRGVTNDLLPENWITGR